MESKDLLLKYWPTGASRGKVLVTTRNRSLAIECTSKVVEILSWDVETGSQFLIFLLSESISADINETKSALDLSRKLDGHALAISQMAGLILRRSWTIQDCFRAYQKSPNRLRTNALDAAWQLSFESLSDDGATLLGIISFLMPDKIQEEIFLEGSKIDIPDKLQFCSDEFRYF